MTSRPDAIPAYFLYGEALREPDERLIHIETIAARSALHDWTIRAHRHQDLHQVLLIDKGQVDAELDTKSARVRGPGALLVPPGTVHSFRWQAGTIGLVLSFAPGLLAEIAPVIGGLHELLEQPRAVSFKPQVVRATDLRALGQMMLREFGRSAFGRQPALRGLLAALLANVMRLMREIHPEGVHGSALTGPRDRELAARFRRLIEASYREHRAVRAYARELHVSETRLRRACLAAFGKPPVEVLHTRLLIESERLLRYTTMSIAKVAFHLGFEDPAYFSRFFTRLRRASPREFRAADTASGQLI